MIAYVRGTLAYVDPEEGSAVVESGGIGYRIFVAGGVWICFPPQDRSCVSILIFR